MAQYTTVDDLIAWMQLPADDRLQESEAAARKKILERAVDVSKELIDQFCRRTFGAVGVGTADETRYFYPAPRSKQFPAGDLREVASVKEKGIALAAADYYLRPATNGSAAQVLVRAGQFESWRGDEVTVAGKWAYGSVPAAVEQAALKIAQKVYLSSRATGGVVVVQDMAVNLKMFDTDAYKLLNPYRVAAL